MDFHVRRYDGLVPYEVAWADQRKIHAQRVDDKISDTILLLQHSPVYTAGKRTEPHERPSPAANAPVIDVDRGGKITWHGPGQLVGYPIVKLADPVDVVAYVRRVEQLLIDVCAELGLATTRVKGRSGVWVPGDDPGEGEGGTGRAGGRYCPARKVGAIGIRVAQGVTMHGFALNCENDLSWFTQIVPCGIADAGVTSLSVELGRPVPVAEVVPIVERHLSTIQEAERTLVV